MREVTTLSMCLSAVDEMVKQVADNMDPAALREHLEKGPWVFLHMNAIGTAEEWLHSGTNGQRVRIVVPRPNAPRGWPRTKTMRRAVESIIEVEQWPLDVKLDLTVPPDLTTPEALRGE